MDNFLRFKHFLTKHIGFCEFIPTDKDCSFRQHFKDHSIGIYCLIFRNHTFYIGQAVDIPRRLSQHSLLHDDITHFAFISLSKDSLDHAEENAIKAAECHGIPLTNIMHVSNTIGDSTIDSIINTNKQAQWLEGNGHCLTKPHHISTTDNNPSILQYQKKYTNLAKYKNYSTIISLAYEYISKCIPEPFLTEKAFWSISCLPSTTQGTIKRIFCININMMETFATFFDKEEPNSIYSFINISKETLAKYGETIRSLKRKYNRCTFRNANYRAAGYDQITIEFSTARSLYAALQDHTILQSAKTLNLRLMKKGKNIYSKYHCPQLASDILNLSPQENNSHI